MLPHILTIKTQPTYSNYTLRNLADSAILKRMRLRKKE